MDDRGSLPPVLASAARHPDLLETIVESIPTRVFWKDRASRYLGCNTAFARDAGVRTPTEVVGRTDDDLAWRAQAERYRADDRDVMDRAVPRLQYLEPQTTPEGATVWLRTSKVPLRDARGRVIGVLGIYDDVTSQHATEQALRLTQVANDRSRDAICHVAADRRVVYANASFAALTGYSRDELARLTIDDLAFAPERDDLEGRWAQLMASGSIEFEAVLRDRHGAGITVEISADRVRFDARDVVVACLRDTRRRRAAELELRTSERRFRAVIGQSPVATCMVDRDGRPHHANAAWIRLWGEAGAADGRGELGPPALAAELARARRGESVACAPRPHACLGGTRWLRTRLYPVTADDGTIGDVVVTHEDLTSQLHAEGALRESEQRFRGLLEDWPDPCGLLAEDNHFRLCNRAAAACFGYPDAPSLLRAHPGDLSPLHQPDGRLSKDAADEAMRRAHEVGLHRFEWVHRRRDGVLFPVEVTLARISVDGRPELYAMWRDISARKAQERALVESRRLHEEAQRIAHVGHWLVEHATGTVRWSDETYRIFGVAPGAPIDVAATFARAVHPDDRARVDGAYADALASHRPYEVQHRIIWPDGTVRWLHERGETTYDAGGPVVTTGTVHDITDYRRAEDESAKLRARLDANQRLESVGRLAGGVAHDFNNMLGVILGRAALALEQLAGDHPARAELGEIFDAAQRSAELTRQLLAFARRQTVTPVDLDLDAKIASLLKMLGRLIGEDIALRWTPGAHDAAVRIDPSQVDQVLTNLCVNARDAIGGRGGTVRIETARVTYQPPDASAPAPYVRLTVTDDGCGMDDTVLANLFEPFFTTKAVGEGSGLGLATVYGIVKQNHGHLDVTSAPGRGSSFRIYLPAVGPVRAVAPPPAGARPTRRATVLLVEDEPALMRFARRVLEKLGYTVIAAPAPRAALDAARAHPGPIHVLISDVIMPEMGGWELARELQAMRPGLQVLFMSGYTADVLAPHGVLSTETAFLQKPFTTDELATRVSALADRAAAEER